jgi:hypothetical protein
LSPTWRRHRPFSRGLTGRSERVSSARKAILHKIKVHKIDAGASAPPVRFWNRYKPRATAAFGCPVECSSTKASHKQNSEALLRRTPEGVCPHGIGFSEKVRSWPLAPTLTTPVPIHLPRFAPDQGESRCSNLPLPSPPHLPIPAMLPVPLPYAQTLRRELREGIASARFSF